MKSTQAMRDRIRELMSREQDDYDRAVECVLDDLEGLLHPAQAAPNKSPEWFCQWLKGFLDAIPGRDELDAFDANSIRNTLNEVLAAQPPAAPVETKGSGVEMIDNLSPKDLANWKDDGNCNAGHPRLSADIGGHEKLVHVVTPDGEEYLCSKRSGMSKLAHSDDKAMAEIDRQAEQEPREDSHFCQKGVEKCTLPHCECHNFNDDGTPRQPASAETSGQEG